MLTSTHNYIIFLCLFRSISGIMFYYIVLLVYKNLRTFLQYQIRKKYYEQHETPYSLDSSVTKVPFTGALPSLFAFSITRAILYPFDMWRVILFKARPLTAS